LHDRRLRGCKFRRQHPIGPCFADFACIERHLVVELDGYSHEVTPDRDVRREASIESAGFRVIRSRNEDVIMILECVVDAIRRAISDD
jgi:very-short-patch-repair endonuclease